MERSLNFLKEEVISTSQNNGLSSGLSHTFEEHVFPVTDSLLINLFASSKARGIEALFSLNIGQRNNDFTAGVVGDSLEIVLWDSSDGNAAGLNEILESEVINTSGAQDDVGTCVDQHLAPLLADIKLSLSDLIEGLWIMNEDLDSHGQSIFVQVEINKGDFGICDGFWHALGGSSGLNSVSVNKHGLLGGHSVSLQNVDGLDWVLGLSGVVDSLDSLHSVDSHISEEVALSIEELGRHRSFGGIDQGLSSESVDFDGQVALDVLDGLLQGKSVTSHDRGWMNVVLDKLVTSSQEFGGKDND